MSTEDLLVNSPSPQEDIRVLNGRPVWMESAADCRILRHICLLPGAWNLLRQISQGERRLGDFNRLVGEGAELSTVAAAWDNLIYGPSPSEAEPAPDVDSRLSTLDDDTKLLHLFASLDVLRNAWENDPLRDTLRALLVFSDGHAPAEIALDAAGLVIHPGSLVAEIGWKARYAATFTLTLITRRGRVDSQIADDIVKRLRERTAGEKLPTPSDVSPADVRGKRGVIVFLHGLMSTDVGLFDPLIHELNDDPTFKSNFLLLGYPHDTLTGIQTNAGQLLDRLEQLFPPETQTPLAFVAHSRGGLFARKVAVGLYDMKASRWKTQLAGCVTFGTPHYGTPLAEYPRQLLGIGVTAISGQTGGFASASDVLALIRAYEGNMPGVSDLRSPNAIGVGQSRYNFVSELRELERRFNGSYGCALRLFIVGGKGPHHTRIAWMTRRIFRSADNDCAVELSSSAHPEIPNCQSLEVHSDHFSYFLGKKGFDPAIAFLDQLWGHERKIAVNKPMVFPKTQASPGAATM